MNSQYIHVTPHFHYDVIFMKTFDEYMTISLEIIKKALRMMDEIKGYTFCVEQTIVLEELYRRSPRLRAKLARAIQNGQLEVTCGMYTMPDMNLPNGESMIRQIERGRKWLKEKFNLEPKVCHITDCFGHHRQIPQILKKCGYEYYLFSRGMRKIGPTEFWWKGIDGTKILTHWNYRGYGSGFSYMNTMQKNWNEVRHSAWDIAKMATTDHSLFLLGGDFCPPLDCSEELLREISKGKYRADFSTLTKYMNCVNEAKSKLLVIKNEFNPLFEGCYSSRIYLKQRNRQLENELLTLEKIDAVTDSKHNDGEFKEMWDDVLINQFHDTVCGSIIDDASDWAEKIYKRVQSKIIKKTHEKIQRLATPHLGKGQEWVLAVFNPTLSNVSQKIEVNGGQAAKIHRLEDSNDRSIVVQKKDDQILFTDSLMPMGTKFYRCYHSDSIAGTKKSKLKVTTEFMENPYYRLHISRGVISSLVEKKHGLEFVNREKPFFNTLAIQLDRGDPWLLYDQPVGDWWKPGILPDPMPERKPLKELFFAETKYNPLCDRTDYVTNMVEVIEKGPVRCGLRIKGKLMLGSAIKVAYEQDIYLYSDLPRIDFSTRIIPMGKHYRLRACFATILKEPRIIHEIPMGQEKRCKGEFPAQNWVNYIGSDRGLLFLNRGLAGNNFQDGVAMISLFRSVAMETEYHTEGCFCEGREHRFEYAVIPYTRTEEINPAYEGQIYNAPPVSGLFRGDSQLGDKSFVKIDSANITISAFRKEKQGYLLRLYETQGKIAKGTITISLPVEKIVETDALGERELRNIGVKNGKFKMTISPFEIKTYRLYKGCKKGDQ